MAAVACRCGGAARLGPRRLAEGGALAGQFPGHPQTARRATGRDDGAALCGSLCAAPGPGAPPAPPPRWAPVREHFPQIAIVDGSTLEALRKKTQVLQERVGLVLGAR